MSEWISVEDRLPEPNVAVLICEEGSVREAWRETSTYATAKWRGMPVWQNGEQCFHPTHWMPMPEPPKP